MMSISMSSLVLKSGRWNEQRVTRQENILMVNEYALKDTADHVTAFTVAEHPFPNTVCMHAFLSGAQDFRITCSIVCQKKRVYTLEMEVVLLIYRFKFLSTLDYHTTSL